ncbi:hypothetical protein EVAR_66944_1 [Eumeta japonica]|uniref:Uncharacterized protein n=1 Tax=Eumeta variegata TaxID=151549 RepID=A0A4C1SAL8_EUMVA|nr:hypothetical protein EVAR_66944_1 [Eumeta japonica]
MLRPTTTAFVESGNLEENYVFLHTHARTPLIPDDCNANLPAESKASSARVRGSKLFVYVESSRDADADVRLRSPPVAENESTPRRCLFYHDCKSFRFICDLVAKVNSKLEITIHGDIEFILESSSLLTASLSTSGQRRIHGAMDVTAFLGRILLTSSN